MLLDKVADFRIGDNSRYFTAAAQADPSWTSSPMNDHPVIDNKPYTNLAGDPVTVTVRDPTTKKIVQLASYQVVNYDASFAAADAAGTPLNKDQKDALLKFNKFYGTEQPGAAGGSIAKIHRDVIKTTTTAKALHEAPIKIGDANVADGCSVNSV